METKTLREAATEKIRQAIFDGRYRPGERLRQQELARLLGYSAIPVREALHQLAAEGLVILDPQRGARVVTFSSQRLKETYEVRIRLENWAIRLAARRMTPVVAAQVEALLQRMDAPDITDPEWLALDWEFHDCFYRCAGQEVLREMIMQLRQKAEPYLRLELARVSEYAPGRLEHRRIFQACLRGDVKAAQRHTTTHFGRVARGITAYLEQNGR